MTSRAFLLGSKASSLSSPFSAIGFLNFLKDSEDIEDLARYAAMKEKPLKRLKTALMDEYRE